MKIALCLSGRWNEHCAQKWIDRTQRIIPHDRMFTGLWNGQNTVNTTVDYYFDEPENEYHPIIDVPPYPDNTGILRYRAYPEILKKVLSGDESQDEKIVRQVYASANWHKQILIHNEMMKTIPEEYDMVIRTRFDAVVSEVIPWEEFIEESYEGEFPIGFHCMHWSGKYGYNELNDLPTDEKYWISDGLIMHPRELWDTDLVDSLYKDKQLRGAESGWYQVLSEPLGMFHKNYMGGCYLSDRWEYVKDVDESLHN